VTACRVEARLPLAARRWRMTFDGEGIVSGLVAELEKAWNAGDGRAFARPFAEDADFVNIRGHHSLR
jgi:hypothetical protein